MTQLTYPIIPAVALAGQIADNALVRDVVSRVNGEASDNIPFGVGVCRGASDDEVELPDSAGDVFIGVVIREFNHENAALAGVGAIPPNDSLSVMKRGRIWVIPEVEGGVCTEGGAVFMRISTGGVGALLTQQGAFCAIDDATTAGSTVRVLNSRWGSTQATAGDPCILELLGPAAPSSLSAT